MSGKPDGKPSDMDTIVPPLAEYLAAMGVTENTPEEQLAFHKKQHKKLYHRAYAIKRREQTTRLENTLSKAEHRKLKHFAKRYKRKKLNRFLLDCAFAYLEDEYVDHDVELTMKYLYQIRAIGNNINQVVHQLHYRKDYTNKEAYQHLKNRVNQLHSFLSDHMKQPPKIKQVLEKLFTEVPESIHDFERFLNEMKAKHLGNDC